MQQVKCKPFSYENLLPRDGELCLYKTALEPEAARKIFHVLLHTINWQSESIRLYGKSILVPRLVAWHGDRPYKYSGIVHQPCPWTPELLEIKMVAETLAGASFNSVLLNLYRDGRDGMGWHADDEPELGSEPTIASISLGAERRFQIRNRQDRSMRLTLVLPHGSCLVMAGTMQRHWQHQVAKTKASVGPRINLTFRRIV